MNNSLPNDPNISGGQTPNDQPNSYVDTYLPPQQSPVSATPAGTQPLDPVSTTDVAATQYKTDFAAPDNSVVSPEVAVPTMPDSDPVLTPPVVEPAPAMTVPVSEVATPSTTDAQLPQAQSANSVGISESLEDQNIFFLLGVEDGSEEEKESFLDELQQVIWEDFLESDVELLITQEEQAQLNSLIDKTGVSEDERQEEIVTYLEKLIPDLEEIMLEKALQLKEDMVKERIAGMREYFVDQTDKLAVVDEAESLIQNDKWRQAAEKLNNLLPPSE